MKHGTIRNVVLASYPGAGKTSLTEAFAFSTGIIPTMGSVLGGNTIGDFEPEEVHRHHSLSTALLQCEWQGTRINVLDTPGMVDYGVEVQSALRAADGVVLVVAAGTGLRAELERVWESIQDHELPCLLFINEMDKANTDLFATVGECEQTLGLRAVPLTIPAIQHGQLAGAIDLLPKQLVISNPQSSEIHRTDIPKEHEALAIEARRRMTELVAEINDQLIETYLTDGELPDELLLDGLTMGTLERKIVPVLSGSATRHIGIGSLLEAMTRFLPSPEDRAALYPIAGIHPQTQEICQRHSETQTPFSGFVFKTTIDPFMGRLTYVRVMSGTLQADSGFFNASRLMKEKGGHLFFSIGKKHQQITQASAGDLVAIAKLKDTQTGDTICDEKHPIVYPGLNMMKPVMSYALEARSNKEIDKVSLGLHKLVEEDPSLEFLRNEETKEMLLSGVGQVHIDATLEKLRRKYGVDVNVHMPKVPYKETIHRMSQAQGKYKKQTGGHGQFGDCWLQIEPLDRGKGLEFHNKIVGGAIPRNFIPAVEKGVIEAMRHGTMAGFPVVDVQVTLYDGSHHPVDSSEMAFKVAASMGFKKAMESAQAGLLEPVMAVEVTVPDDLVGTIIGDLNARRGRIQGMDVKGHHEILKAHVPLAELLAYAPALTSLTAGKGHYRMEFFGYEEVPKELVTRIIEEHRNEVVGTTS